MEIENQKSVLKWKNGLRDTTFRAYRDNLKLFLTWLRKQDSQFSDFSPDQLIEYQVAHTGTYEILDLIQLYINELDWRYTGKRSAYSTLRSLFKHNRAALPDDVFRPKSDEPPVEGILDAEKIRDMILSSNKLYQAIFTSMFQGALDLSMYDYWNENGFEDLLRQLKNDPDFIKISLPGRKRLRNVRPFYTYIGKDAIEKIKAYLQTRPEEDANGNPSTHIFYTKHKKPVAKYPVTLYWLRHLHQLGIINRDENTEGRRKRYGVNLHEMRDVYRTLWEKSPAAGSAAEFFMGHVVDPLGYQKAANDESWTLSQYEVASPWLNILSSERAYGLVDESEIKRLERKMEEQKSELDRLKQLESTVENFLQREREATERANIFARQKIREYEEKGYKSIIPEGFTQGENGIYRDPNSIYEEPPTLPELLVSPPTQPTYNNNGQHIIVNTEEKMIQLLNQDYELVKELSNNRYLLKHP